MLASKNKSVRSGVESTAVSETLFLRDCVFALLYFYAIFFRDLIGKTVSLRVEQRSRNASLVSGESCLPERR